MGIYNEEWKTISKKKKSSSPMMGENAIRLQKQLHIDCLVDTLMSQTSLQMQQDGWKYIRVIKPSDCYKVPKSTTKMEYFLLDIPNEWGDNILFRRYLD